MHTNTPQTKTFKTSKTSEIKLTNHQKKTTYFYRNILSSKNSKELQKVIHHILSPNENTLKADPTVLNKFFNPFVPNAPFIYPLKTSEGCFQGVEKGCIGNKWVNETIERLVRNNPANNDVIISYIDHQKYNTNSFKLRASTYDEVVKSLKSLWNRCSIGYDNIPVSFIYPIAKHTTSFLTSIINNLTND